MPTESIILEFMKRILLQSLSLLLVILTATSCSEENEPVQMNNASEAALKSGSDVWSGVIGVEKSGVYEIVADRAALIADLESILLKEEGNIKLTSLEIVEKIAENDPKDIGYMIIGSNGDGVSIGIMMAKIYSLPHNSNIFILDSSSSFRSTSCWGCSRGCFLKYYNIEGERVPYCDEGVCGNFCTKKETER